VTAARLLAPVALVVLLFASLGVAVAHYTPASGDRFAYDETIAVGNGMGNYSGYTESTVINGSLGVTSVLKNGSDQAYYFNDNRYQNSEGTAESWSSSGSFVFSPQTLLYVVGTDNQTGYTNPNVWFFIDNTVTPGQTVTLLNSDLTVVGTSVNYYLNTAAGTYVRAIFVEGNGTYERNDAYGVFAATYNWKAYFDPTTGFIIGYVYTEQDTDQSGVDGFTLTDTLAVTSTSYALTAGTAPPSSSGTGSGVSTWLLVGGVLVAVVIIVVVVVLALRRARRRHPLPRHSATGQMTYYAPPMGPPPPGINLTPSGQPAVQQIVIKETVKVNCRYCGALIDTTAEKCPFCGAART